MDKKQHLISSLRIAINALKNGTIHYNWTEPSSCNAGVVSQAVLGVSIEDLDEMRDEIFPAVREHNLSYPESKLNTTWKNAISLTCPITGKNMPQIITDLENAGLRREDITHLEYLSNPAILKESGIQKEIKKQQIKIGEDKVVTIGLDTSLWGRITGKKISKSEIVPIYIEKNVEVYPSKYYSVKENLILYLSAWVRILTGNTESPINEGRDTLEAELLNAVAEENFERAAEIRDQLAII
jgi:hypothetical protein